VLYEFSISLKYLLPRVRYLSVSVISFISILVIALVVWLTIVFFSATEGLEGKWTEKLITMTAPIRVIPTENYYSSYYYLIDTVSQKSNFTLKGLSDKVKNPITDPYDPETDPALEGDFPRPIRDKNCKIIDLAKVAMRSITQVKDVHVSIFDTAFVTTKIKIERSLPDRPSEVSQRMISQPSYLVAFDPTKPNFETVLMAPTPLDLQNIKDKALLIHKGDSAWILPRQGQSYGVILPRAFRDAGVIAGDSGTFSYFFFSPVALSEQQLPFFVAGFYDPGIIPTGGKIILVPQELVSLIGEASHGETSLLPTGFNVSIANFKDAASVKAQIEENLNRAQITPYFRVETYDQYDFTKDIFQQLKSEKNLFSLISIILVIVACSNIISMLIILVHDKSREIAILRALGASKKSIGFIFGFSGFVMGALGSLLGAIAAAITVKNLAALLGFLGKLQGFEVLNAAFYGETMPDQMSHYALWLVIVATALISTVAGSVAAWQAARQNTSDALRSE